MGELDTTEAESSNSCPGKRKKKKSTTAEDRERSRRRDGPGPISELLPRRDPQLPPDYWQECHGITAFPRA